MRVLVTGATGFIGRHLLRALAARGDEVIALSRQVRVVERDAAGIRWLAVDDELENKLSSLKNIDVVFHLATAYGRQGETYFDIEQANVAFPLVVLQWAANGGCDTFINTDSFFSRPEYRYGYMKEYSLTKRTFAEWGALTADDHSHFHFVNARLEHVYGTGDDARKFFPMILRELLGNVPQIDLTACNQKRDFVFVEDVVRAYIAIARNTAALPSYVEVGVGTSISTSLRSVVERLHSLSKSTSELRFGALKHRPGEIMNSHADISFLSSLGWSPEVQLDEGLCRLVAEQMREER
ncbi:NAD-dependent epimerase/dehydratase family protein [Pandoraea apista]|uniref:NAD-dependent epimerase/dehydratase family protein n=1 Tax=Pandoraea apista TaxID=93218 RepID=UPI000657BF1B|nr:NAD(P)-dependent oxidoreductase [Pandoraea apista]ALS66398.2 hypothetical protein AT395_16705 [Pandoraea apista]CFB61655.1 dTDP-4-dehydro-6-deoxyglucose reductase [Pandoraea apista]